MKGVTITTSTPVTLKYFSVKKVGINWRSDSKSYAHEAILITRLPQFSKDEAASKYVGGKVFDPIAWGGIVGPTGGVGGGLGGLSGKLTDSPEIYDYQTWKTNAESYFGNGSSPSPSPTPLS